VKHAVLDLFSGMGMFSLGLERSGGFETVGFCEIEPYARAVLKKHWPDVPQNEDVRTLCKSPESQPSSSQALPAKTYQSRESESGLMANDPACFSTPYESLATYDQIGSCWRTCQPFLTGDTDEFSGRWPRSGMMRSGTAYRLDTLAHRTDATAYGMLPTPSGTSNHGKNHVSGRLDEWGGSSNPFRGTELGKIHSPRFEEWMMGAPDRWTELTSAETPLSRKSRK